MRRTCRLTLVIHIHNHRPGSGAQNHLPHRAINAARCSKALPRDKYEQGQRIRQYLAEKVFHPSPRYTPEFLSATSEKARLRQNGPVQDLGGFAGSAFILVCRRFTRRCIRVHRTTAAASEAGKKDNKFVTRNSMMTPQNQQYVHTYIDLIKTSVNKVTERLTLLAF